MASSASSSSIIFFGLVLVVILLGFITFTIMFYWRRTSRMQENFDQLRIRHAREIEIARQEIYRRSLEQVSAEIHDNLGQQLSLIKLNLSLAVMQPSTANGEWLNKLFHMTSQLMEDMRHLSKNMYYSSLESVELPEAIEMELERMKRGGEFFADLNINGIPAKLDQKTTFVLLRMFQESMSILTFSKVRNCQITLDYLVDKFILEIFDNGVDMDSDRQLGFFKLENRGALIGAAVSIIRKPNKGTGVRICLPYNPIKTEE